MKSNTRIYFVPVEIGATPKVSDQFVWNLVGLNNALKYGDCPKIREIRCSEPDIWAEKQKIKGGTTSAMFRVKMNFESEHGRSGTKLILVFYFISQLLDTEIS